MVNDVHIDTFSRFIQVSRETIESLKKYENLIIESNKKLNLIGKSTIESIWIRHFLDSAQVIDLIDKNDKLIMDLGTGAGLPGLILSILLKDRMNNSKIKLIEKSVKKFFFLETVKKELDLNVEIINENILKNEKYLQADIILARAFKPLKSILELIHNKSKNWEKIIIFMGKNGKQELLQASKIWDIEYKQRVSITSIDSHILEINKIRKK